LATRRRTSFPGLPQDAQRELIGLQDGLLQDTADLRSEAVGRTTDTKTATYSARFNEAIRVAFPAAGGSIIFPSAGVATADKWIEVLLLTGSGPCKVVPESLLVDGAATVTLTTAGRYAYRSDGISSWWRAPSGGGGGGGGEDLAATLALGNTSGANDMIISAGRFIQLGAVGPVAGAPQLRSGDAVFRMRGSGTVVVTGEASAALNSEGAGGQALLQAFGLGGNVGAFAQNATGTCALGTNSTNRLVIASTGEWTTPAGAAGQVLTHQGAGVPPIWAAAGGGGTDPRIFAWFGV
jgi:hypothetical protein